MLITCLLALLFGVAVGLIIIAGKKKREEGRWLIFKARMDAELARDNERMRAEQRARFARFEEGCREREAQQKAWHADFKERMARGETPKPEDWNMGRGK